MSLSSEMSRLAAEFEAAKSARLAEIASIAASVHQDCENNRDTLSRVMSAHSGATRRSLRNIFGTAALTRGAAEELVERFHGERETSAGELHEQLSAFVGDLHSNVAAELSRFNSARGKVKRRAAETRRGDLKELRECVEAIRDDSAKLVEGFAADRKNSMGVWNRHLRTMGLTRKPAQAKKRA